MAELSVDDVEDFTKGRLAAANTEVQRMLDAALRTARREVGWHVSPIRVADDIVLDGPDSRILWLPTLKIAEDGLTAISEDGVALDLTTVKPSRGEGPELRRRVALRKTGGARWTAEYGGIEITMDHGYDETEAEDWRQAILTMVDQMSLVPVSGGTGQSEFGLAGKRIDDVDYRFSSYDTLAQSALFSVGSILDDYKLHSIEFF